MHQLIKACQEHATFQNSVFIKNPVFLSFISEDDTTLIRFHTVQKFYNLAQNQYSLLMQILIALQQQGNISFNQLHPRTRIYIGTMIRNYEYSFFLQQNMLKTPIPSLRNRGELDASLLRLQLKNHVKEVEQLFSNFTLNRTRLSQLLLQLYQESSVQPKRKDAEEPTEQPAKRRLTSSGQTTFFHPPQTQKQWYDPGAAKEDLDILSQLV